MILQNSSYTTTDVLAVIGAVTGTVGTILALAALGWDIYKWKTTGVPKLRIRASGPMISNDPGDRQQYISIRVTNVGDKPTTLTGLTYRYYKHKPSRFRKTQSEEQGFFNLFVITPPPLPFKLEVGSEWSHLLVLHGSTEEKARSGYFFIEIEDTTPTSSLKFARTRLELNSPPASASRKSR